MDVYLKLRCTIVMLFSLRFSDALEIRLSSPYAVEGDSFTVSCLVPNPSTVVVQLNSKSVVAIRGALQDNKCDIPGSANGDYMYSCTCTMTQCTYNVTITGDHVTEDLNMQKLGITSYQPTPEYIEIELSVHIPITQVHIKPRTTGIAVEKIQLFNCTTDAGHPTATIQWYMSDGTNLTEFASQTGCNQSCSYKVKASSELMYTGKLADNNKNVYCNASNVDGRSERSHDVILEIWYGPKLVEFSPSTLSYTVKETGSVGPITCSADCRPNCTMTWIGPNHPEGTAVLHLQGINRSQAGDYKCIAGNQVGNVSSENIKIIVNYGPYLVELFPSTLFYTVNEMTGIGKPITCSAKCRPNCTMTWSGPNLPDDTTHVLDLQNINRNQTGGYFCTASNNISSLTSGKVSVIVNYGPNSVMLFPSNPTYTVTENNGSVGPITCTADCRPNCTMTWNRPDIPEGTTSVLDVPNITRNQSGDYICTANNSVGIRMSEKVTVIVNYGPSIVVLSPSTPSYTVTEGSGSVGPINCTADCRPNCIMTWSGYNLPGGTTSALYQQNITRNQSGDYICTASNIIGNMTSAITVIVNYGPSSVVLNPSTSAYTVTEKIGSVGPISCTADCRPSCTMTWNIPDIPQGTTSVLYVQNITRNQAGDYRCTAKNDITELESRKLTVIVHYAPAILRIEGNTTYYENDTAELRCHVESIPNSSIMWSFMDKYTAVTLPMYGNTNVLKISRIKCLSMGKYSCVANNSIGFAEMDTSVNVKCSPRLNTIEYDLKTIIGVRDNEPLNITAPLLAYPTPWINWQLIQNISVINITRDIVNTNSLNRHFSTVFIQNMTEDDFGCYAIYAGNGIGKNTYIGSYNVRAARRPNKPSNVTCSVGHNYVIVNWQPEFDGGSPQIFRVLYKTHLQNLFMDHQENVTEADYHPVKIVNLKSSSSYLLKVRAENIYNSEVSDEICCNTTEQVLDATETSSIIAVGVGAGMGSAVAVICVVITILFVFRRLRTKNSKHDKEPMKSSNEEEENEGLKDNPLYVSSADDFVQRRAILSKVSNVAKQGKINKPIEMGCVYENHDDFMNGNDQIYANQPDHVNNIKEYNPTKNKDGLIYAELDLAPVSAERRFVIRGLDNINNYAIIDLNKRADPLPSDEEDEEKKVE